MTEYYIAIRKLKLSKERSISCQIANDRKCEKKSNCRIKHSISWSTWKYMEINRLTKKLLKLPCNYTGL